MHIDWGAVGSWASFAATLIIGAVVVLLIGQSRKIEPAVTPEVPVRDVA